MTSPAAARLRVRFSHIDAAGIVYFPRYVEFANAAFPGLAIGGPGLRLSQSFLQPLRLGEDLDLRLRASESGAFEIQGFRDQSHCVTLACEPLPAAAEALATPDPRFETDPVAVGAWEAGPDGRLHVSRYLERVNTVIEQWFESGVGSSFTTASGDRTTGTPTVGLDTRCLELPKAGQLLEHSLRVLRVGHASLLVRLWASVDGRPLLVTDQTLVHVRHESKGLRSEPWPAEIRAGIADRYT